VSSQTGIPVEFPQVVLPEEIRNSTGVLVVACPHNFYLLEKLFNNSCTGILIGGLVLLCPCHIQKSDWNSSQNSKK
jgi:hypothetical protein